ncbi:MAG: hypothetical protein IPK28_21090 [Devosia sp.]|nr:hypothetical protein [Devosia sp.]
MPRLPLVLLVLFLATPAAAADWFYENLGVPIAYADNGVAQFQFACRGGDLAMGFWVRAPHRQVAGAGAMNLALTPDPAPGSAVSATPAPASPRTCRSSTSMAPR